MKELLKALSAFTLAVIAVMVLFQVGTCSQQMRADTVPAVSLGGMVNETGAFTERLGVYEDGMVLYKAPK